MAASTADRVTREMPAITGPRQPRLAAQTTLRSRPMSASNFLQPCSRHGRAGMSLDHASCSPLSNWTFTRPPSRSQ